MKTENRPAQSTDNHFHQSIFDKKEKIGKKWNTAIHSV